MLIITYNYSWWLEEHVYCRITNKKGKNQKENIVVKGESVNDQHFLFSPQLCLSSQKDAQERILLKTCWEKEEMLVTSISSFSHNVFYPIKDRNHHLSFIYFVVCNCFQFGHVQNFVIW